MLNRFIRVFCVDFAGCRLVAGLIVAVVSSPFCWAQATASGATSTVASSVSNERNLFVERSVSDASTVPTVPTVPTFSEVRDEGVSASTNSSSNSGSTGSISDSNQGTKNFENDISKTYYKTSDKFAPSGDLETTGGAAADDEPPERFLQKLRPFKRARSGRVFGGRFVDLGEPSPPEIEKIEPPVEAPVLTRENPSLPPLDLDGRSDAGGPFATRAELDALREETKAISWSKGELRIVPYGFINLSVSSDTERAVPGEFVLYMQSPDVDDSSDFTIDARTSRFGVKIDGPRVDALSADARGGLEFDFQGVANGSKNKGGVQLRRAFVELVDAERERKFLAGQDWEIISPLAPQMLNYLPCGFVGNLQYRRPQLRFEQGATFGPNMRWLGQIAICDDVLCDYASTSGVSPSSAAWPIVESRGAVELLKEARDGLPITLGVSGHIGEQNYKFSPISGTFADTSERVAVKTWSANFDVDVPIVKTQRFQGECFTGTNLSSFCGGVNQGVDLYRRDSIRASGGWGAIHSDWTEKFATNVGYGVDKPNEDDLVGTSVASNGIATSRTSNEIYFVNFIYNWNKNLMTGLEASYWNTGWQKADVSQETPIFSEAEDGKSVRTEFTVRFSF